MTLKIWYLSLTIALLATSAGSVASDFENNYEATKAVTNLASLMIQTNPAGFVAEGISWATGLPSYNDLIFPTIVGQSDEEELAQIEHFERQKSKTAELSTFGSQDRTLVPLSGSGFSSIQNFNPKGGISWASYSGSGSGGMSSGAASLPCI